MSIGPWIGCDLDGTLALCTDDIDTIGAPIEPMCNRVRRLIREGFTVKIVTARVSGLFIRPESVGPSYPGSPIVIASLRRDSAWAEQYEFARAQERLVQGWCALHLGTRLEVTALKDFGMIELWDDRAVHVEPGTGRAFTTKELP